MRFAGDSMKGYLGQGPDFNGMGRINLDNRSSERRKATEAEANVSMSGLDSMAKIRSAEWNAKAIAAQGQAQASATRAQGVANMLGSIAGGIGNISFGNKSSSLWNNDPFKSSLDTSRSTDTFRYYNDFGTGGQLDY